VECNGRYCLSFSRMRSRTKLTSLECQRTGGYENDSGIPSRNGMKHGPPRSFLVSRNKTVSNGSVAGRAISYGSVKRQFRSQIASLIVLPSAKCADIHRARRTRSRPRTSSRQFASVRILIAEALTSQGCARIISESAPPFSGRARPRAAQRF